MLRSLCLALCFTTPLWLSAQNEHLIDSLEEELRAHPELDTPRMRALQYLWHYTVHNDMDRADGYAAQLLREGIASGKDFFTVFGYRAIGTNYDYKGQTDSAVRYYHIARNMYREQGRTKSEGAMLFNLAITHREAGRFDSARLYLGLADTAYISINLPAERGSVLALTSALERDQDNSQGALDLAVAAYALAQEADDSTLMADINQEIALAYEALGDYETAIEYYERNAAYYRRSENDYFYTNTQTQLAGAYWELDRYAEAIDYAQRAIRPSQEKGYAFIEQQGRSYLAGIYSDQKRYEEAIAEYRQLEPMLRSEYDYRQRAGMLAEWARAENALRQFASARDHARESLALSKEYDYPHTLTKAREHLATAYAGLGNYAEAYEQSYRRRLLKDSLHAQTVEKNLAEFTAKFEKERQDRLISEQKSRLTILETQAKVDRLQRIGLIAGLLGLLGLLAAVWAGLRQRNLRLSAERERLSAEVVDHQKKLSAHALQMAQKGQLLDQLGEELRLVKGERPDDRKKLNGLLRELSSEERIDQDWENFRTYFQGVHGNFTERLQQYASQALSPRELRLAALIKMQLNNQEIGSILSVSQDSLYKAKFRLRKKLPGATGGELDAFIREF